MSEQMKSDNLAPWTWIALYYEYLLSLHAKQLAADQGSKGFKSTSHQ